MNPDKLFDYLDGKLSPADREELEEKLMSDAQLRRQFNIAREIHRSGRDAREVIVTDEDPAVAQQGAKLARRIAIGAIILVFLNVFVGLAVITFKNKKSGAANQKETEIRRQLTASLGAAAQNAMPPPSFTAGEIQINAPRADWETVASKIIAGAVAFGGSGTKGLPNQEVMTVVVDIPTSSETQFRQAITSATAISPMPEIISAATEMEPAAAPNERTIIQVRITAPAR